MMVGTALKHLARCDYIQRYDIPASASAARVSSIRRSQGGDLVFDEAALLEKEQRDRAKLEAMLAYVGCRTCRQEWIQRFFGEKDAQSCHSCDTCQALGSNRIRPLREEEIVILQKALSGVARMSGRNALEGWVPRYGLGLITRMLVGSEEQRLAELRLNQLSTYGLLKEEGRDFVRDLLEECLRFGLLRSTGGTLPMVTLTALGEAVMKRETPPRLIWPKVRKAAKGLPRGKAREPLVPRRGGGYRPARNPQKKSVRSWRGCAAGCRPTTSSVTACSKNWRPAARRRSKRRSTFPVSALPKPSRCCPRFSSSLRRQRGAMENEGS